MLSKYQGLISVALATLLLSGCTASGSSDSDGAGDGAVDGTLRAAFAGGSTETLNYLQGPTALDYVRARLVHAPLCELAPGTADGVAYGVVESIDISSDRSTYTLHVRKGISFTDGSPLTSADVLYSLRAPVTLKGLPFTMLVARNFTLDAATTPDPSTVVLPTAQPIADGREVICQSMLAIKDGTTTFTPQTPSSGPFTISAFEPGQSTLLERNPGYYGKAPAVKQIELVSIADATARVNALRQGQVDYVSGLTPALAQSLKGEQGLRVTTSKAPYVSYMHFTMNTAVAPFNDPRVREAFKLAVNRQRILDTVYYGLGEIGNDLPALGFATYDAAIPQRPYDPEKARQLLAEAGAAGMSVDLTVGPELPGMVETATLIAQDLKAVGVNVRLRELPAGQLFADYQAWLALPFKAGYTPPALFESNYVPGTFTDVDALVQTARSAPTPEERLAASHGAQQMLWQQGNQLAPVFVPNISAADDTVSGVRELQFPDLSQAVLNR